MGKCRSRSRTASSRRPSWRCRRPRRCSPNGRPSPTRSRTEATMAAATLEWLNILLRWTHVMAGIAWIGTSFFFIWLDASLRKRAGQDPDIAGESWMVHGGGFYLAEKYTVAPERLPAELHWFKYEAYFTWLSGFLLLVVVYYFGAEAFLIDR